MYSYMKGLVTEVFATQIVLEVGNIGYIIFVPNPYSFKIQEVETVFLYQHVREDEISLYGFKSKEARDLFIKLISVKGIGPKSALAILATGNVHDVLNAIDDGNIAYLMKFPGIGQKASQQIILDLKGKINFVSMPLNENISQAEEALLALGYKKPEIKRVLPQLDGNQSIEILIKQALKLLLK